MPFFCESIRKEAYERLARAAGCEREYGGFEFGLAKTVDAQKAALWCVGTLHMKGQHDLANKIERRIPAADAVYANDFEGFVYAVAAMRPHDRTSCLSEMLTDLRN